MKRTESVLVGRHPATVELGTHFDGAHIADELRPLAVEVEHTARTMIRELPDCRELTVGLRKLLEARECFIRAAMSGSEQ